MAADYALLLSLLPFCLCLPFAPSPAPPPSSGPALSPYFPAVDANAVIEPLLRPFSHMYDMMQENHKAISYAEKIESRRAESPLSRSHGLFDLIDALQETTTTTTTQSPLRQLLAPYIDPFKRGAKMFEQEMKDIGLIPTTTTTTTPRPTTTPSFFEKSYDLLFAPKRDANGEERPALFASMMQMMTEGAVNGFSALNNNAAATEAFRAKRDTKHAPVHSRRAKRQLPTIDLFDSLLGFNEPVSLAANPFTPNPLMSLFTPSRPLDGLQATDMARAAAPKQQRPSPLRATPNLVVPSLADAAFHPQDPFYNPLLPQRTNKAWRMLMDLDRKAKKVLKQH